MAQLNIENLDVVSFATKKLEAFDFTPSMLNSNKIILSSKSPHVFIDRKAHKAVDLYSYNSIFEGELPPINWTPKL